MFIPSFKQIHGFCSLKLAGQCAAGADCGYCHCQHSRPVHPDKKHLGPKGGFLDLPPGTTVAPLPSFLHLTYPGPSRHF